MQNVSYIDPEKPDVRKYMRDTLVSGLVARGCAAADTGVTEAIAGVFCREVLASDVRAADLKSVLDRTKFSNRRHHCAAAQKLCDAIVKYAIEIIDVCYAKMTSISMVGADLAFALDSKDLKSCVRSVISEWQKIQTRKR